MNTKPQQPRSAAEINDRMSEIGVELATTGRFADPPNGRALRAELEGLKAEYAETLRREGEAVGDAAEIARRVEAARRRQLADAREARIEKAVADALKREPVTP